MVLLTHNFPKPHKHHILNIEVYVQCCSVGRYFERFHKNDLEIIWDGVHRKMKFEAYSI